MRDQELVYFNGKISLSTLKERYRELAKKYHPDKPDGCTKTFQHMHQEYVYLKNKLTQKNRESDSERSSSESESSTERNESKTNENDCRYDNYEQLCNFIMNRIRSFNNKKHKNKLLFINRKLSIKDIYISGELKTEIKGIVCCPECNGIGYDYSLCELCDGIKCSNCDFKGIFVTGSICYRCKQSGQIEIDTSVLLPAVEGIWGEHDLSIPAQIHQYIVVSQNSKWKLEGEFDIKRIITIRLKDALLGVQKPVRLPSGKQIMVTIPPAKTTFQYRVTYNSLGLLMSNGQRGCMHFDINIRFPKNTEERKTLANVIH